MIGAIEGGIFQTFCHHGDLLKAHDELTLKLAAHPQKKDITKGSNKSPFRSARLAPAFSMVSKMIEASASLTYPASARM
jgi:hypothetical protein